MKATWEQVRARRLARSRLTDRAGSVVEAVRSTCGIQAQLQAAAGIGVGVRADGVVQEDVRRELWETRSLVRTWTLRGTLHLHPADELGLWIAASRHSLRDDRLDPARRRTLVAAFADALDGRALLRAELADEVARRVGEWAREPLSSGWAYLTGDAVAAGVLCHGPPRGTKATFVRVDQWVGDVRRWEPREALLEALRRFVRVHGPVAPRTLGFLGIRGMPARRELLAELRDELVPVDVEGEEAWLPADDADFPDPTPALRLVPEWDSYLLGFREHERLLFGAAKELYWDTRWKKAGRYETPVQFANVLVGGAVAGKWQRHVRGGRLDVDVLVAEELPPARRAELEEEAERVAAFLGLRGVEIRQRVA